MGWRHQLCVDLGGRLYLAVILDLHSRRVVGWAVSNRMKRDLAIRALNMAIALRRPPRGCIHHTDLGSQYCSHDYQKLLRQHGFQVSMSGAGRGGNGGPGGTGEVGGRGGNGGDGGTLTLIGVPVSQIDFKGNSGTAGAGGNGGEGGPGGSGGSGGAPRGFCSGSGPRGADCPRGRRSRLAPAVNQVNRARLLQVVIKTREVKRHDKGHFRRNKLHTATQVFDLICYPPLTQHG
ncbi:hypothetical protein E1180_14300 [Roseibium denhamense]|uniref:DDE-type integrase/transposase/recombinase n=1 Tax=Roseibium denhamense TaxID=76305 RepID=UPI0012BD2D1B|nr:hypothetical protein [Roseibium denhamense]